MWYDQEKKIQKIDCLASSLLIQGLSNEIFSFIDSNKPTKDLWDALARHMLGSEYGEQDRKAAILKREFENHGVIKSKGCGSSENEISESENQSENDCQEIEKECDNSENSNVIAPGMFRLSLSQSVSPISVTKTSYASNSVESKLKRKRRKRTSSKQHDKQVNKDVLRADKDFVHFSDLDILISVRRPKSGGVIDTQSAHTCNNARNAYCNSYDVDVNDLFVFDDVSLRQYHVSKMPFRKKPSASLNVPSRNGIDLLGDRSSNFYTIALNEVTSNSLSCLLAKASSSQSWLWHQRLSHLNFATINNLVKNNLVQGLPKMKFEKDHLCSSYEQGKIHQKHHKSKMAFASNKPVYLLHIDLYGPMRVGSINGKRYVLVVVDDYSRYTWVFFLHSKDEASEVIISFIKKTQVNLQLQVQRVRTDNGTEFKNKTLAQFFDEVKAKWDIGVFVGYSIESAAFRIYNKRTCSKHMTGNRALLTNFVEKFLETVCFGNNDFAVIAGYRDVVIGSMTIKKGRKKAKSGPTKDDSDKLDAKLDEDMEDIYTEEALNEGRQSIIDTDRPDVSTARPDDDTTRPDVSTARQELSTAGPTTTPTTSTIFDDEEMTLANTLTKFKYNKAKGVTFKDSKSTDRPARSILTLKPVLTINPKDKGKGVLEEPKLAKKMTKSDFDAAQIARDEEIARQLEVEL
nr:putative ribonuclease H-like domain-containing protein [Tanacetum cinerariifolium]